MSKSDNRYWKKVFGVDLFKVKYHCHRLLYERLGIKLPKLKDQRDYWTDRGRAYMDEMLSSGYLDREVFFQNMLIDNLRGFDFDSFFEAGCGFGWNIKRVKEEFPFARVGGVDFSSTQLKNAKRYIGDIDIDLVNSDNSALALPDNAYDVGFSLGVFMNIHPSKIKKAASEMMRVCKKYIIHLEYDENNTTTNLRKKRAFKTNIISHDYRRIYESLGAKVISFVTYRNFGEAYKEHQERVKTSLDRWEKFEGAEKYVWIMLEV